MYLRPAIVSPLGTTVFALMPIMARRESSRSSGGTPQFVLSTIRSRCDRDAVGLGEPPQGGSENADLTKPVEQTMPVTSNVSVSSDL